MPDIETIIAKWKASFAGRTRYEGQEPREDELLVAEVERLRRTVASHELDLGNAVQRIDRLREINDALRESAAMDAAEVERLRAHIASLQADLDNEAQAHQIKCLADIREAVGDPTGKLMQDDLVMRIATMRLALKEVVELATTDHADGDKSRLGLIGMTAFTAMNTEPGLYRRKEPRP